MARAPKATGFTLIELLICMGIIAILAAILFPIFASAKMAAHKTADLSNIRQIGMANLMYSIDEDDHFLSFPFIDVWQGPNSPRMGGAFWTDRLMPYVKSKEIFQSHLNQDRVYYPEGYWLPGATSTQATLQDASVYRVTYTLNHMLTRGDRAPEVAGAVPLSTVERVAEIAMAGPGQWAWNFSACIQDKNDPMTMHYIWMLSDHEAGWGYELWGKKHWRGGFNGGANFAYLDGHARFSRSIDAGTDENDLYSYHGRDLFRGQYVGAITRLNVGRDGTCPADRGANSY